MDCPSHHPPPPPDELFDIDTTVDPTFIISLIRKLLPVDSGSGQRTQIKHNPRMDPNNAVQGVVESMDIGDDNHNESTSQEKDKAWEDHGCVLWDLAASTTHAELMVQNLILQVLHANLLVTTSSHIREICLGIIGNLACHEGLLKHIESTSGLVNILVGQLFLDDTQCLCELCRILTTGLYGAGCTLWAECFQSDDILRRGLWIAENTLNPHLIEKSVGLLLGILEGESEVGKLLIPPLMTRGLTSLLINLLSFEMSKLVKERIPERYSVLEMILRAIEALSASDSHSKDICSSIDDGASWDDATKDCIRRTVFTGLLQQTG
ncbi:unnamed protein product [Eruca vesicaria subsp. sativa]|uniref:Uncharacterized protein n=1 Tax=Eruca vesicaria subsp. sativa TaxID=29727 RepID=A0ABC8KSW2_ERUVS|nr:unnamed protein product [Eruca vesicaria subsp. sativa]